MVEVDGPELQRGLVAPPSNRRGDNITIVIIYNNKFPFTLLYSHNLLCIHIYVCCCFTFQQHISTYQDGYQFVVVYTHGDFTPFGDQASGHMTPYPT